MHFSMAEKWDHDKAFNLLCSVVYSCSLPSPFWEAVKRKLFAGLGLDLTLFPSLLLYSSLQRIILHFLNCRERSWCWQWLHREMGFNEVRSTYCMGTLAFASWKIASCHIDVDDFVTKGTDLFAPMHFIVRLCFKRVLSCCFISTCIFLFENILLGSKIEVTGWTLRWDSFQVTSDFYAAEVCSQGRYMSIPLESGERNGWFI